MSRHSGRVAFDPLRSVDAVEFSASQTSFLDGNVMGQMLDLKQQQQQHFDEKARSVAKRRLAEIETEIERNQPYDDKIYKANVKTYGVSYEHERKEHDDDNKRRSRDTATDDDDDNNKKKKQRHAPRAVVIDARDITDDNDDFSGGMLDVLGTTTDTTRRTRVESSDSDSEVEQAKRQQKKTQRQLKQKNKEYKKKRRKQPHGDSIRKLLNEAPDILVNTAPLSVDSSSTTHRTHQSSHNNNNSVQEEETANDVELIKSSIEQIIDDGDLLHRSRADDGERVSPAKYIKSSLAADVDELVPIEPLDKQGVHSSSSSSSVSIPPLMRVAYTPSDDEIQRLKRLENMNTRDMVAFEEAIHNVKFSSSDMSWFMGRLMHNQSVKTWIPKGRVEFLNKAFSLLRVTTRAEDDEYLRSPIPGQNELECAMNNRCQGLFIPGALWPCVLVQYLDFEERMEFRRTGKLPKARRLCVMCRRYVVQYAYINFRSESRTSHTPSFVSFCNIPDMAGEYSSSQMIKTSSDENQAVIGFVVAHIRTNYTQVVTPEGYLRYEQTGYFKPSSTPAQDRPFFP